MKHQKLFIGVEMRLWLVQMNASCGNKKANLEKILGYIARGGEAKANLIAFPEMSLTGYMVRDRVRDLAEQIPGPSTKQIETLTRRLGLYVILGMPELNNFFIYNAAAILGPSGFLGVYRKLHLVTCMTPAMTFEEDMFFRRGKDIITFETAFGRVGVQICYDFYYPEVARAQALQGALVLINVSAVPVLSRTDVSIPLGYASVVEKFELLTRARAIENLAYFGYVNLAGMEAGVQFGGGSCVSSHMGVLERSASKGEGAQEEVLQCDIDIEELAKARIALPYLKDARPEILQKAANIAALI